MSGLKVPRHLKDMVKVAEQHDWTVEWTKKCHLRLRPPPDWKDPYGDTVGAIIMAGTASDHRAIKNARAHLRRVGLNV